ncbi:DUF7344 domain-containing protein [Haloarcula brevis]|uniref:DUF7344 domain-containing protein n=1 Tax=Haloarcula brevis TaxID=3111453 RepID=UPI00300F32BB
MVGDGGEPERGDEVQQAVNEYIRELPTPPEAVLEMEYVFETLAHPRRRYLVYSLLSSTEWTLPELATKLVAWEQDIDEEAVTDTDRDDMFTSLYHAHIPKLVDHDIITYRSGDESTILADVNAVQVLAALEGLGASVDAAQEVHARSDYHGEQTDD